MWCGVWLPVSTVLKSAHLTRSDIFFKMCFNPPMSAAIGVAALTAAGLFAKRGKPFRSYSMFVYFALMEVNKMEKHAVMRVFCCTARVLLC